MFAIAGVAGGVLMSLMHGGGMFAVGGLGLGLAGGKCSRLREEMFAIAGVAGGVLISLMHGVGMFAVGGLDVKVLVLNIGLRALAAFLLAAVAFASEKLTARGFTDIDFDRRIVVR
jgi:hypothetical protein